MSNIVEYYTDCYVINLGGSWYINTDGKPASFGLSTKLFDSHNEASEWMKNNCPDVNNVVERLNVRFYSK